MEIICEKSFSLESYHRNIHECTWKLWFQVRNSDLPIAFLEHISCFKRNTVKKKKSPQGPTTYSSWVAQLGNNCRTPSDKLAMAEWPGSYWVPASSFVASIFHRCSLVSSNFRIFFKWFSFCQLGTVQGIQLGELSRMDQSKMLASLIWIRLDCLSLALGLAHPLFSSPVDFHPPPSHLPHPLCACYELTMQPSHPLPAPSPQAVPINGQAIRQSEKDSLGIGKFKYKSSPQLCH